MNLMVVGRATVKFAAGEAAQAVVLPLGRSLFVCFSVSFCTPLRTSYAAGQSRELTNQLSQTTRQDKARAAEEVIA